MAYTSDDIILWGKISQPLAARDIAKDRGTKGSAVQKDHDVKLYVERKTVEWYNNEVTQDADILYSISNFLFALEGIWGLKAQFIDGGSGGQVAPVSPSGSGNIPNVLDWEIEATSSGTSPLAEGERTVTLDGTGGKPDYRGYNINFFRNGVTQNTTPRGDGSTYYSWNRTTAQFTLFGEAPTNGAAQLEELFRITPDIVGVGTLLPNNDPDTIFLSADGTYSLAEGYYIWKIRIKPTAADTVKIGTTLAGDDIMFDKLMVANVYGNNGVTIDVGEGASQTIYFTGFTATAQIDIYILPI